ncbi:glucose-6-phosphate isomerase [Mycoplasmopsis bovigenitalium]|uniref:glucose-6-phosphate isomerase n=1 Tax=Mycoplasmopsis bovigenitalium TaxID=2112 RepID=UPI00090C7DCA|nr:glucose-6-phosphate isomerase [Mycoplasmopsis bovigenitalium]BAW18159.1 glucose-6-phosphate isomerase [Mycoplasmopsis bovigenitalium]
MARLNLKFYNYYPDFNNDDLVAKAIDIIHRIRRKNIDGFENFGFHELALNFSANNILEIQKISQLIISKNTKTLIIFTDTITYNNFVGGLDFIFKFDTLTDNKINYIFINSDEPINKWFSQFKYIKNTFDFETTSFIFSKLSEFNLNFIEFVKMMLNYLQVNFGYYRTLDKSFIIGKEIIEQQLNFIDVEEKNRLIIPNILDEKHSFFSEINLLLLFLKGVDISNVLEGYVVASQDYSGENIKDNLAFQYAYALAELKQNKQTHLLTFTNESVKNLFNNYLLLNNSKSIKNNFWSTSIIFPNDIYTYGPYTLTMNNFFVSLIHINSLKHDYRITPELLVNDGVPKFKQNRLSHFTSLSFDGILNTFNNVAHTQTIVIELNSNSEFVLGSLVCFIYWANIFEWYIKRKNPFN